MTVFVLRRLGFVVLTVLLSSMLVFAATHVLPGDVATMVLGREASQQAKDDLRKELGLDKPLVEQYGSWLGDLLHGDWGTSISTGQDVRTVTLERLRNSAMLALVAFLMYVPLGIFLGVVAAWRRNSALDHVLSAGSLAFIGLPEFVTAIVLIAIFSRWLGWLPSSSAIPPGTGFFDGAAQPHPPGDDRVARQPGLRAAHDPRRHHRGAPDRLRPHRPAEGPFRDHRGFQARAAQLPAADDHRGRRRRGLAHRRADRHRVGLRLPGSGQAGPLRRPAPGHPAHPGHDHDHRDHLRARQPGRPTSSTRCSTLEYGTGETCPRFGPTRATADRHRDRCRPHLLRPQRAVHPVPPRSSGASTPSSCSTPASTSSGCSPSTPPSAPGRSSSRCPPASSPTPSAAGPRSSSASASLDRRHPGLRRLLGVRLGPSRVHPVLRPARLRVHLPDRSGGRLDGGRARRHRLSRAARTGSSRGAASSRGWRCSSGRSAAACWAK